MRHCFIPVLIHLMLGGSLFLSFPFFFNDTATTEIYTLSLHDALPICADGSPLSSLPSTGERRPRPDDPRSEEHTSELQSRRDLVCRLLLDKKKKGIQVVHRINRKTHDSTPQQGARTL